MHKQIDAVYGLVAQTLEERTTDEWLELFRELEIPAAPLNTPDALFDDPHLNAVGLFETIDTPHGPVRFPGVPTWFSRTPARCVDRHPNWAPTPPRCLKSWDLLLQMQRSGRGHRGLRYGQAGRRPAA